MVGVKLTPALGLRKRDILSERQEEPYGRDNDNVGLIHSKEKNLV